MAIHSIRAVAESAGAQVGYILSVEFKDSMIKASSAKGEFLKGQPPRYRSINTSYGLDFSI